MRHFAFLRAINVGGRTVKMERLRELFESFGLSGAETFIASGNVIFETAGSGGRRLETKLEAHLRSGLGYDVATFLRTWDELRAIAEHTAFPPGDIAAGTVYVSFIASTPSPTIRAAVGAMQGETDAFHVSGREIYWLRRSRESAFTGGLLEKAIGAPATMRNMNTVHRLVAKYAESR